MGVWIYSNNSQPTLVPSIPPGGVRRICGFILPIDVEKLVREYIILFVVGSDALFQH